ncbi:MAG: hypothetical protein RI947_834 [Candidatus Parcubacteria bacterium]|jgi:hypothetical protein
MTEEDLLAKAAILIDEERRFRYNVKIVRLMQIIAILSVPLVMLYPERLPTFLNIMSVEATLALWKNPLFWIIVATQILQIVLNWREAVKITDPEEFKVSPKGVTMDLLGGVWGGITEELTMRWGMFFVLSLLISFLPFPQIWNYIITLLITAFLFAYAHMHLPPFLRFRSGWAGCMFGIIMMQQGTILAAIASHAIGNVTATIGGSIASHIRYRQLTKGGVHGS